ncbi:hypothetical protein ACE1OI_003436 [Vibrio cholerae]|uniref:hypothetical protein n=1 Tax=Vibrio cholerae TaxID=666 RepID=UPI0035AAE5F9
MTKTGLIFFAMVLSLFAPYANVSFNAGAIDNIVIFLIFISPLFLYKAESFFSVKKNSILIFVYIFFYIFVLLATCFTQIIPFAYELFHLLKIFYFIPFFWILKPDLDKLDHRLSKFLYLFLTFNMVIILVQHVFKPDFIYLFSNTYSFYYGNVGMHNRWSGLLLEPNTLGGIGLILFILNDLLGEEGKKKYEIISIVSVIASTSKISILVLFAFLMIKYMRFSHFIRFLLLGGVSIPLFFVFNEDTILQKFGQYQYIFNSLLSGVYIDHNYIESRAQNMIWGASIIYENFPFGTGLGSWGDASSRFNTEIDVANSLYLSDTAIFHYFVEQGAAALIYLSLIFIPLFFRGGVRTGKYLSVFFVLMSIASMGLSMKAWPIWYSYLYSRSFFNK